MSSQTPSPGYSEHRPARPIGLVLVDDHPAVLRGLADLLDGEPGIEVLGTAESQAQALDLIGRLKPDSAIVDFHLANENGLDLTLKLDSLPDGPHVIVYSAFPGASLLAASCVAGASAVIAKHSLAHELSDAIRAARDGRRTMPHLSRAELSALASRLPSEDRALLDMLTRGMSAGQIAETLHVSEQSLHERRREIIHALTDRSHAALSAMQGPALHYSTRRSS